MTTDCDFTDPVIKDCVIAPIQPVTPSIGLPLLPLPCIPSISGEVEITATGSATATGSNRIRIEPDPASECAFKVVGNVQINVPDFCIVDADAYEESGNIVWFNNGGTKTTMNGTTVDLSGSIPADPTLDYKFKFWNCHDQGTAPDRTISLLANDNPGGVGHTHSCNTDVATKNISTRQLTFECCPAAEIGNTAGWYDCGGKLLVKDLTDLGNVYGVQIDVVSGTMSQVRAWGFGSESTLTSLSLLIRPDDVASPQLLVDNTSVNIDSPLGFVHMAIQSGRQIEFRETEICVDGEVKHVLVLMSEAY